MKLMIDTRSERRHTRCKKVDDLRPVFTNVIATMPSHIVLTKSEFPNTVLVLGGRRQKGSE